MSVVAAPNSANKTQQFIDFIYLTQVVQSICIGSEAEHYRRILSETGYTRGTLYWQLVPTYSSSSFLYLSPTSERHMASPDLVFARVWRTVEATPLCYEEGLQ